MVRTCTNRNALVMAGGCVPEMDRLLWEHLGDGYNLNFSLFWVIGQQTDFGPNEN